MNESPPVPPVTIVVAPALEVVSAAASCAAAFRLFRDQIVPEEALPPEIRTWRERVEREITPFERSDLDLVFSTISVLVFLAYMVASDGYHETDALVAYLRSMGDDEFLEAFRKMLKMEEDASALLDPKVVARELERDRAPESIPFGEEARRLVSLLSEPQAFRLKLAEVIEWFNRRFVTETIGSILEGIQQRIEPLRTSLAEDPVPVLDALSPGNYETLLANRPKVTIYPVFLAGDEHSLLLSGPAYFVCGTAYIDHVLPLNRTIDDVAERTDQLLKVISDPNRLEILRLLRGHPRYGREIADALGVTAATASYHLEKLVNTGLARLEISKGRRLYYGVNPRGIRELQDCLSQEFLGNDS